MEHLLQKLKTDANSGLKGDDFNERLKHFGTNKKDPPVRTPYWKFFVKAIDDFMLKLLLVCACVDIGFGLGFNSESRSTCITFLIIVNSVGRGLRDFPGRVHRRVRLLI